ncbi:hypothetical protein K1719_022701 [Acacia pycnantha]|nr:hypothetical protein K1719_022701 [Acacia pycnantha]
MSKEEVKDEYITNDSNRKATFKARKGCIMKKASELVIPCVVEGREIIFSGLSDPQPEFWSDHDGVQR